MTSSVSQSSEDVSDAATSTPILACLEDDKEFICNVRERNMVVIDGWRMIKGGKRVAVLWNALYRLPTSLQKQVFLELLQGSDDREDIWLWNEGDEALIDEEVACVYLPWTSAATALERRRTRTPVKTQQGGGVLSAAFEMRTAMICWLALTSTVYKNANKEGGFRDREEWDIEEWITAWHFSLPHSVDHWFFQHSKSYDDCPFTEAMDQTGHSCHRQTEEWFEWWLFMKSQLLPHQQDHIIYLGYGSCMPCLAHKPMMKSESLSSWTPSPALVGLRCIWDNIEDSRDFSKWLLDQPIYGLKEADELFCSLPRDNDDNRYLSWVNAYPRYLRSTVTRHTLGDWQAMNDCIRTSDRNGSMNIRSWCAAMVWTMMPRKRSYPTLVKWFIDAWRNPEIWYFDFLPPPTPAPEFRDAIRESGHTCWEEWEMDDYAAAMAFLNEDPEVVGIGMRKDARCQVCQLQWCLRNFSETFPAEEPEFSADVTELLVSLGNECSRRKVPWNSILASVRHCNVPGPTLNSDHQEQWDLQYTLDDNIDQGRGIRTDHTDINVLHRPHSPIPRAVHLPEDITHMFHPDINIPYVQHHSTDLQNDHHFATATAITDGIQDQSNVQYPTLHDIQPPSYSNSTRSRDVNYSAYGQPWVPYDQPMMQELETSQTQVTGRRSTPLLIPDLVDPSVNNDMFSQPQDAGVTMAQDNPDHQSPHRIPSTHTSHHLQYPAASAVPAASKPKMIEKIKTFLTSELDRHSVYLSRTHNGRPKLPWVDFKTKLKDEGLELVNWPNGVPEPGKDERADPNKGIAGISVRDLTAIYRAIHSTTTPLELRRSSGPQAGTSSKRPRDGEGNIQRPTKQMRLGNLLSFDRM